jgi:hypothetical protein
MISSFPREEYMNMMCSDYASITTRTSRFRDFDDEKGQGVISNTPSPSGTVELDSSCPEPFGVALLAERRMPRSRKVVELQQLSVNEHRNKAVSLTMHRPWLIDGRCGRRRSGTLSSRLHIVYCGYSWSSCIRSDKRNKLSFQRYDVKACR